jgi:hypothetical protein
MDYLNLYLLIHLQELEEKGILLFNLEFYQGMQQDWLKLMDHY